ncbi:arginase [Paenibacillus sp. UNC451MF]|uniref:arginase n=1 Tax=Paenibacillus sp. UNC451MF TaxID=1449063 RepID=UPI000AA5F67A|nr:arginase [Paenibacillus sp. UNC451MF]
MSMEYKPIDVIGVPFDLGAGCRGCRMGPDALRCAELVQHLRQSGRNVEDTGDIILSKTRTIEPEMGSHKAKYLKDIVRMNRRLYRKVAASVENGRIPLVVGGDHCIAIGSIAGAAKHKRIGVIWFDAHGDLNTVHTSPSGNVHGMSLAAALGYGHPALTRIGGNHSKVLPEDVVLIGTRSLDPGEEELIRRTGIQLFSARDINQLGIQEVVKRALTLVSEQTEGVHLSLDVDGLDPSDAPGVGTPVSGGIRLREAQMAMRQIAESGALLSTDFVEVNPALDLRNRTAHAAVELICSLLGVERESIE